MPPLPLLVFVVGTGSLGAEIAAVRLMSPYFGASTIVWANTIGVVLVALSIGYWIGGRYGDRHPHMRGLCMLTLGSAVLLAAVPFVADPLMGLAVGALDSISAGAFLGSLFAVLVLVAIPVLLMGAVTPWALRLALPDVERSGSVAGRLYALSTAGSLAGTLLSALVLIPLFGTRRTFLIFAFAIAATAVMGLRPLWRWALVPAAIAVLIALPVGTLKAAEEGRVIDEAETEYQYARVVEYPGEVRTLELNEGQAVHSIYDPDTTVTGNVWDGSLVLPFTSLDRPPESIAILGNAAGTTSRAYEEFFPQTRIDAVEIDPELTEIGRRLFDMNNPRMSIYHEDARPFIRRADTVYDVITVDAYRQPYIPFYLTTTEFFESVRQKLSPDGVLIVNAAHPEGQDELEQVLSAGIGQVFPHVLRDPMMPSNTLLVASASPISAEHLREQIPALPAGLRAVAREQAALLGRPLEDGEAYTDDRAPVEWLIDRSIVDYAAGG
jgi:spermidine synthase